MAFGFPLYIDLNGNNCVVLGGGDYAADKVDTLLQFGAKVTVISPALCGRLQELDKTRAIRYIPRRYYRGDCTNAYICVAATGTESVNIAISDECKAKGLQARRLWKLRIPPGCAAGGYLVGRFRQRAAGAAIPPAGFAGEPAARVAAGAGGCSGSRFRRIRPFK